MIIRQVRVEFFHHHCSTFIHLLPTLYNVFLQALQLSPVIIIPSLLHTHSSIYHPRRITYFSQYFSFPLSVSFHSSSSQNLLHAVKLSPAISVRCTQPLFDVFISQLYVQLSVPAQTLSDSDSLFADRRPQ